jgi:predicted AlkP superfamily pyrophosphatase or phosphodiesterase
MRYRLLASFALLAVAAFAAETAPVPAPSPGPRLAVIIAVDQLRADYLVRFRPYFVEGGFKRLLEGGADFRNNHYRYAYTVTAPGHATIATGVTPYVHGIVANDWVVRDTWEKINNVEDRAAALVGIDPRALGPAQAAAPEKTGRSPRNLQATTVADQIKLRYGAASKVFSASNKDRSAILFGGKLGDHAYWDELGQMITTTYYRKELPAWVQAFNAERRVHARFGETWNRLLDPKIYDAVQGGPDDAPGESAENGLTRTFPKVINGGSDKVTGRFYSAFDNAPFSAEFLGGFVERAIKEEQLGHHAGPDFLGVSFSQLDTIGHSYGPDSHEVMDSVLRLDRVLASLLDCLDREVGLARCVIVLTADHGVSPLPERVQSINAEIPAGRIRTGEIDALVRKALDATYGALPQGETWFVRDGAGYHLRPAPYAERRIELADAAKVVKSAVLAYAPVAQAFTRAELLATDPEGDSIIGMVRRSYFERGGRDVVYVLKPYFMDKSPTGTTHGMPYETDTNVPQLWFGLGVKPGVHLGRVSIEDIAPTMASLLGVPVPPQTRGARLF